MTQVYGNLALVVPIEDDPSSKTEVPKPEKVLENNRIEPLKKFADLSGFPPDIRWMVESYGD